MDIANYIRVLKLTTKPNRKEWFTVAKITGIMIIIIGALGYIVLSIKWIFG
jgi:protein translocase SEC61 complex gamma subunit